MPWKPVAIVTDQHLFFYSGLQWTMVQIPHQIHRSFLLHHSHQVIKLEDVNLSFLINFVVASLRVNLDIGKVWYAWVISRDENIPETVCRSTTIPEELGRIHYLMSDKTGTLTQNEMVSL